MTPLVTLPRQDLRELIAAALLWAQDHPEDAAEVLRAANPWLTLLADDGSHESVLV